MFGFVCLFVCLRLEACYWIWKLGNFTCFFIFLYSCHPCPLGEIINTVFAAFLICPSIVVRLFNILHTQLIYVWNHLKCQGNSCHRTECHVTISSDHHRTILHLYHVLNLPEATFTLWICLEMTVVSRTRCVCEAHCNTAEIPKHPLTKLAWVLQVMQVLYSVLFLLH